MAGGQYPKRSIEVAYPRAPSTNQRGWKTQSELRAACDCHGLQVAARHCYFGRLTSRK